jgi:hypothetical protein
MRIKKKWITRFNNYYINYNTRCPVIALALLMFVEGVFLSAIERNETDVKLRLIPPIG